MFILDAVAAEVKPAEALPFPSPLVADRDDADGPSDAEWDLMAEEFAAMDAHEAGNHAF